VVRSQVSRGRLHSFEPDPTSFELVEINTKPWENIIAHNVGLGDRDDVMSLGLTEDSINHGGRTLLRDRHRDEGGVRVLIRDASDYLLNLGVSSADIVKIDTDGFEFPIFKSLAGIVTGAAWVLGELHDSQDFSALALLEATHSVGLVKGLGQRFCPFFAFRRDLLESLPESDRRLVLSRFSTK